MKLKSLILGIGAVLMMCAGTAWGVGSNSEKWVWELAPRIPNYTPDPQDTAFYYPLPQVVPFTSSFGWRTHPIYGDRRFHAGVDLGAPEGMPVLSAHSGWVRYANWESGYGNLIIVEYADGKYQTAYAHLSEILVKEGEAVRPRQVIGKVGSTGGVTGSHLHFELKQKTASNWEVINPTAQVESVESYVTVRPAEPKQTISAAKPVQNPGDDSEPPIANTAQRPILNATQPPSNHNGRSAALPVASPQPRDTITLNFDPSLFTNP
ncbi:MAG: peptidoglycan DD-metalloendopeptidase family protein [Leptolyngbyaceae cyanobacterium RU_5_1]|nr:peptidoglycan DD-metalloendopeptidase family protein [Leptolyngbyaceae cyanobacterium RU_5_1]